MPKTSDATGATYAGHTGLVERANGEINELDPSRNADGSVKDGFTSEERDLHDRDRGDAELKADPTGIEPAADDDDERERQERERREGTREDERKDDKPAPGSGADSTMTMRGDAEVVRGGRTAANAKSEKKKDQ